MAKPPASSNGSILSYLVSGGAILAVTRIVAAGFKLAIPAILARWASQTAIGVYFLALSASALLAILGQVGTERNVVAYVASTRAHGNAQAGLISARRVTMLVLGASVAIAISFRYIFPVVEQRLPSPWFGPSTGWVAVCIVTTATIGVSAAALSGAKQMARSSALRHLLRPVLFVLLLYAWRESGELVDAVSLVAIFAIASSIAAVASIVTVEASLRTRGPIAASRDLPAPKYPTIVRESLPLLGAQLLMFAITQGDLWLVGSYDYPSVGQYGAASRLALVPGLLIGITGALVAPLVVEHRTKGHLRELERLLQRIASVCGLGAVVYSGLMLAYAAPALEIVFGPGFRDAAPALRVLLAAQTLPVLGGGAAQILVYFGRQQATLRITAVAAGVFGTAGLLLAPAWGALGAAWSLCLAQLVLVGASTAVIRREFGIWVWASPFAWRRRTV